MKICFSQIDEFLAELTKECSSTSGPYAIEDQILRLTFHYQDTRYHPLKHLRVIAGVVVRGKLIELNQYVGPLMDTPYVDETSARVRARAETIRANIEATARDLNLEVRTGMFAA